MTDVKNLNPLAWVFFTITIIQSSYFLFSTKNLRPIADDYCHALYAGLGFKDSFDAWFTTWTSDLFAIIVNYFLLGYPLVHFPYSIASAVTFIFASLSVVLLIYLIFFKKFNFKNFLIFYPAVLIAYLSFWAAQAFLLNNSDFNKLSNMILHWQIINSQYIFLASLLTLFALIILQNKSTKAFSMILLLLLGFLGGTFGIILALSIFSFLFIFILISFFKAEKNSLYRSLVFAIGLLLGIIFAYFSPGTQARAQILAGNPNQSEINFLSLLNWTFPRAIIEWLQGFLHLGAVLAFLIGLILGVLSARIFMKRERPELIQNVLALLALTLITSAVSQLSEAFSYEAFWHLVIPLLFTFVFLLSLGFLSGTLLYEINFSSKTYVLSVLIGLTLGASGLVVHELVNEINTRKTLWQVGPAPVAGIGDIENKEDWIFGCWMGMKEYKGYPDRENF